MTPGPPQGHDVAQLLLRVSLAALKAEDAHAVLPHEDWTELVLELARTMPPSTPEALVPEVAHGNVTLHTVLEALTAGVELVRAFVGG